MKLYPALLCLALPLLGGCTFTSAVSQTNIPADRKKVVEASVERFIVLNFNFDNDYALRLSEKLKETCPGGEIRGVTTHDTITYYFLVFFMKRQISARGYCTLSRQAKASIEPDWSDLTSYAEDDTP